MSKTIYSARRQGEVVTTKDQKALQRESRIPVVRSNVKPRVSSRYLVTGGQKGLSLRAIAAERAAKLADAAKNAAYERVDSAYERAAAAAAAAYKHAAYERAAAAYKHAAYERADAAYKHAAYERADAAYKNAAYESAAAVVAAAARAAARAAVVNAKSDAERAAYERAAKLADAAKNAAYERVDSAYADKAAARAAAYPDEIIVDRGAVSVSLL